MPPRGEPGHSRIIRCAKYTTDYTSMTKSDDVIHSRVKIVSFRLKIDTKHALSLSNTLAILHLDSIFIVYKEAFSPCV